MSKKVVSLKILLSGKRAFRHGELFLGNRDPIDKSRNGEEEEKWESQGTRR